MAAYNCVKTVHPTLTAATVDTITCISNMAIPEDVTIVNRTGAADLIITVGYGSNAAATPVADAADTYRVPVGLTRTIGVYPRGVFTLKILGNANAYSVERQAR